MKAILHSALLLSLTLSLVTGCALSPQQVKLEPALQANNQLQGAPLVQVRVEDQRPSDIIGTRGGLYGTTSFIRTANNLKQTLAQQTLQAFANMGAQTQGNAPFPVELILYIEQLSYQPSSKGVIHEIALASQIRVVASKQGKRHEGRFHSNQVHRFLSPPNEEENEDIINTILSNTLNRLINDPELIQFIQE